MQNVFQHHDSAIMVVDETERFVAWNNGAERIFGYKLEEIVGQNSSALLPDDNKYLEELEKIIDEVKVNSFTKAIETERKTKDDFAYFLKEPS